MDSLPLATKNIAVIPENTTLCSLTARVPGCLLLALQTVLQALLHVGFGIAPGDEDLAQKCNVCNGQPERVDFGEALLIGEGGYMAPELVEGRVDVEHPLPLADVGGMAVAGVSGGWREAVWFSSHCHLPQGRGAHRGWPRGELVYQSGAVQ